MLTDAAPEAPAIEAAGVSEVETAVEPDLEQSPLPFAVEPLDAEAAARRLRVELEALLFVTSEPLAVAELARLTGAERPAVAGALSDLASDYADRGIVVREIAGGYRFATAAAARGPVEAYLKPPKTSLSSAAMETLAVAAYLQPVTKAEIEAVRGVNVDGIVATLVDRRFLADAGRRDVPGRPVQFTTTPEFLESFGLRSLAELPPVNLEAMTVAPELPVATQRDGEAAPAAASGERFETTGAPAGGADTEEVHPSNQ